MIDRLNAALEGRYQIDREVGEGGMATVFLADDLRHERKVALKVLKPELAAVVGADRFLAEIKTTANLQHPHILPLLDSGEVNGFLSGSCRWSSGDHKHGFAPGQMKPPKHAHKHAHPDTTPGKVVDPRAIAAIR